MDLNWLDWTIVGFLAISVIGGFREGFIRLCIGFLAMIFGFIFAAWFYGLAADPLLPYVKVRPLANLLGFQLIFFGTMAAGALVAALIVRVFSLIGLTPVDRVMGGAFGVLRGALVLVIVTMAVMAFAPKWIPKATNQSSLAPYVIRGADTLASATPFELKQGVAEALEDFQGIIKGFQQKKLVVRQE